MIGRREFGVAGLSAVALAALEGSAFAQPKTKQAGEHAEHDDMLQACAKECSDCQRACDSCATHCAHQLHAGHKEHMTTLASCQDCADFWLKSSLVAGRSQR